MKVLTILGTRPEIIRLSRVVAVLDQCVDHVLVHTGQNYDYELNRIFFDDLAVRKPDHFLEAAGETPAQTVGNVIAKADAILAREPPDAVLILGDTNSSLAAYPAKRRKIPIFHMEAGNRCFDSRVPEEINRRIVDHLSDVNMPYTEQARRYLLAEGLPPDQIIKTGSPLKEVLDHYATGIQESGILDKLDLEPKNYLTVSLHREENVDSPEHLTLLATALNDVAAAYDRPLIFSCHPRTRARLQASNLHLDARIRPMPPLGFLDYNHLQLQTYCALSDSGTITEESALLGFPAITMRQAHERPEGMDHGVLIMSGLEPRHVVRSIDIAVKQYEQGLRPTIPDDYQVQNVSWVVVKAIMSYVDYVNRRVWRKK